MNWSVDAYVCPTEKPPVTADEVVLLQSVPSPHVTKTSAPVIAAPLPPSLTVPDTMKVRPRGVTVRSIVTN